MEFHWEYVFFVTLPLWSCPSWGHLESKIESKTEGPQDKTLRVRVKKTYSMEFYWW